MLSESSMEEHLPNEIKQHLPLGFNPGFGTWLVLPSEDQEGRDGINTLNHWLREQDWYPVELGDILWFGDDGVGNLLGWDQTENIAVLWNPADGSECWHKSDVQSLWQFIQNGYE